MTYGSKEKASLCSSVGQAPEDHTHPGVYCTSELNLETAHEEEIVGSQHSHIALAPLEFKLYVRKRGLLERVFPYWDPGRESFFPVISPTTSPVFQQLGKLCLETFHSRFEHNSAWQQIVHPNKTKSGPSNNLKEPTLPMLLELSCVSLLASSGQVVLWVFI